MSAVPTTEQLEKLFSSADCKDRVILLNVRSSNKKADSFDDRTHLVFNKKIVLSVQSTCDPGVNNLFKPVNDKGCAIVMNGYWKNMWKMGYHKGKYKALVQASPVVVFRDNDKDDMLDYSDIMNTDSQVAKATLKNPLIKITINGVTYIIEFGLFGINCHRASEIKLLEKVGLYSAGCCVVQSNAKFLALLSAIDILLKETNTQFVDACYVAENYINNL